MKTVQTKAGELFMLEMPADGMITHSVSIAGGKSVDFTLKFNPYCDLHSSLKVIGRYSELEDKDLEEFVENDGDSYGVWYRNYCNKIDNTLPYSLETIKESFRSLCKFHGIEDDLDNYLIIKRI